MTCLRERNDTIGVSVILDGVLIRHSSCFEGMGLHYTGLPEDETISLLLETLPDLGFFEWVRLLESNKLKISLLQVGQRLNWPPPKKMQALLPCLFRLPRSLQDHLDEKKVRPSELLFMTLWTDEVATKLNQHVVWISQKKLSLQVSLKSLEILMDLALMGKTLPSLNDKMTESEWLQSLQILRYPASTEVEKQKSQTTLAIQWPSFSKARIARRGDRSGYELSAFIASDSDITKMISTLERARSGFVSLQPESFHLETSRGEHNE